MRLRILEDALNDIEFESMLSFKERHDGVCIRDALFDYFCKRFPHNLDTANAETKKFTDILYLTYVNRRA